MAFQGILVDSSVLIDYLRGRAAAKTETVLESNEVSLSVVSVIELYRYYSRIGRGHDWNDVKGRLAAFKIISLDAHLGELAAELTIKRGLSLADAVIYATAAERGLTLLTSDYDLKGLLGVSFIRPPG